MGAFIVAATFTFFAVICFILGTFIKSSDKNFNQNAIKTVGYIVGFESQGSSLSYNPEVMFYDNGEEVVALCTTSGIKADNYPAGTKIDIKYLPKKIFNSYAYEVRAENSAIKPTSMTKVGKVMIILGVIFWMVTLISFITIFL